MHCRMVNSLSGVETCDARNEHTALGGWLLCSCSIFCDRAPFASDLLASHADMSIERWNFRSGSYTTVTKVRPELTTSGFWALRHIFQNPGISSHNSQPFPRYRSNDF